MVSRDMDFSICCFVSSVCTTVKTVFCEAWGGIFLTVFLSAGNLCCSAKSFDDFFVILPFGSQFYTGLFSKH